MHGKRITTQEWGRIIDLADSGASLKAIARMTGISIVTVRRYKKKGPPRKDPGGRGGKGSKPQFVPPVAGYLDPDSMRRCLQCKAKAFLDDRGWCYACIIRKLKEPNHAP